MDIPKNTYFQNCIRNLPHSELILQTINLEDYCPSEISFRNNGDIYYHVPENIIPQKYIAAFDIDWTLTYSQRKLFPDDEDDIYILPHRKEKLEELFKGGYTIVLITNQTCKSVSNRTKKIGRIRTMLEKLKIPCFAFIGTTKEVQKPNIDMWNLVRDIIPDISYAFFVGDALGREQDYSDNDKIFAENINVPYFAPEEFFDSTVIHFPIYPNQKEMIVFIGMPGSGKSSYFKKELEPLGYVEVCQDNFTTKNAFMKYLLEQVEQGNNIVVNKTNPKQSDREVYYKIAEENDYKISVIYFLRDGRGWNKVRAKETGKKVPDVVYHVYFKNLEPPTKENTPGNIFLLE